MKYIKLIIIITLLNTAFTGCSYVSDYVEGELTNRASFGLDADYSGGIVTLRWDKTDSSSEFAGIEIYRTTEKNDEYETYEVVATKVTNGTLGNGLTTSCTVSANLPNTVSSGEIYFYRVGFIHWDEEDSTIYNSETSIDAISGYAKIVIP